MQEWLPLMMLAVMALLVGTAPWHKADPKHEFIVSLLMNIEAVEIPPSRLPSN